MDDYMPTTFMGREVTPVGWRSYWFNSGCLGGLILGAFLFPVLPSVWERVFFVAAWTVLQVTLFWWRFLRHSPRGEA